MKTFKEFTESAKLKEAVTAGDSGGDPIKIASGETSGAIMNLNKKKKENKDVKSE